MQSKTRTVVCMAVLVALMLLFGFTPIGYIPMPFADLTLMCLPVLIGTFVLGLRAGFGLAVVFILTSLLQLVTKPSALALVMLETNPLLCVLNLILPRLLIPFAAWGVWKALERRWPRLSLAAGSAAGSLINTAVFLLLLQVWFVGGIASGFGLTDAGATALIWGIVLTNGLPEAALAAIICPLVARALIKSIPPLRNGRKETEAP
ncbi:MAG: ECF transporter S component [Clostridia bacterium]|nr:ECF transporter S component [Clostridia bacterium]